MPPLQPAEILVHCPYLDRHQLRLFLTLPSITWFTTICITTRAQPIFETHPPISMVSILPREIINHYWLLFGNIMNAIMTMGNKTEFSGDTVLHPAKIVAQKFSSLKGASSSPLLRCILYRFSLLDFYSGEVRITNNGYDCGLSLSLRLFTWIFSSTHIT
jgi:hypothetical protein